MKKLSLNRQYYLFKNLSDMFRAGFNVKQAFQFLKDLNNDNLIKNMEDKLVDGYELSSVLEKYIENDFYNQIKISEQHGDVTNCLVEISKFIEIKIRNKRKIHDVLFYPIFLLMILILAIVAIDQIVLPQLGTTSGVHEYLFKKIYLCLFVLIIFGLAFGLIYFRLSLLKRRNFIAKLPIIGNVYKSYMAYFLSMQLHLMLSNGMENREIVQILREFKSGTILAELGIELRKAANSGKNMVQIANKYDFVPNEFITFFKRGSQTDELSRNLNAFKNIKFDEMMRKINRLINLVQPILFLLVGLGIVIAYMSVLMPIYNSLKGM